MSTSNAHPSNEEALGPNDIHTSPDDLLEREASEAGVDLGDGLDVARQDNVADFQEWSSIVELEGDDMLTPDEHLDAEIPGTDRPKAPEGPGDDNFTLQSNIPGEDEETEEVAASAHTEDHVDIPLSGNTNPIGATAPSRRKSLKQRLKLGVATSIALGAIPVIGLAAWGVWFYTEQTKTDIVEVVAESTQPDLPAPQPQASSGVAAPEPPQSMETSSSKAPLLPTMITGEENSFSAPKTPVGEVQTTETISPPVDTGKFYPSTPQETTSAPAVETHTGLATALAEVVGDNTSGILSLRERFEDLTARTEELSSTVQQTDELITDINARLLAVEEKLNGDINALLNSTRVVQAITLPSNINMRRNPSLDADVIEVLKAGTTVNAVDSTPDGNWLLLDNKFWIAAWVAVPSPSAGSRASSQVAKTDTATKFAPASAEKSVTTKSSAVVEQKKAPARTANTAKQNYSIVNIQPGMAWLRFGKDSLLEVHEGDPLPGYGMIVEIYQTNNDEWIIATEAGKLPVQQPKF